MLAIDKIQDGNGCPLKYFVLTIVDEVIEACTEVTDCGGRSMNTMSHKKELQACRKRLCKIDKILYKLEFSIAKKAYKEGKYAVVALKTEISLVV